MQTRPTIDKRLRTLKEARNDYKIHGPRLSSQESRQLERGAELLRRAEKLKQAEKNRKASAKRRQDKERRESEARRRMGIPSQGPVIARSQVSLTGWVKAPTTNAKLANVKEKSCLTTDPWETDGLDDDIFLETIEEKVAAIASTRDWAQLQGLSEIGNGTKNHLAAFARPQDVVEKQAEDNVSQYVVPQHSALENAQALGRHDTLEAIDKHTEIPSVTRDIDLEDFLISNTQVEREIADPTSNKDHPSRVPKPPASTIDLDFADFMSTQDVSLSAADLTDMGLDGPRSRNIIVAGTSRPVLTHKTEPLRSSLGVLSPVGEETKRQLSDRKLMPPPSIVKQRGLPSRLTMFEAPIPRTHAIQYQISDFDLSSQDCREIAG